MTERELIFRQDEQARGFIETLVKNPYYKEALEVLRERRNNQASAVEINGLANDGMISTRINSQRIGMEGFIVDLADLCNPPPRKQEEVPATFGADEAFQKLESLNQE